MAKPDCQKCGLCCCAPAGQDSFCDLTKDETKQMRKLRLKIWRPSVFDQMTQTHIDFMLSKIPKGRFVEVKELAAMVAWLASEDCALSTGAVFDISGGRATY